MGLKKLIYGAIGTPAQAGFDSGDGVNRLMIKTSCTGLINTTLITDSNVGKPGVWVFSVANATIATPPPRTTTKAMTTTPTKAPIISTPNPYAGLSNLDGTPCNCNKATTWLDIVILVDKSKSIGDGGLGAVRTTFMVE